MDSSDLIEKLRTLAKMVSEPGFREESFDLWEEIKPELSTRHRFQLLAAWSRSVSEVGNDRFVAACSQVISELRRERPGELPLE